MYTYMIKCWNGKLLYTEAQDIDAALKNLGLTMLDVKRAMPVEYLDKAKDREREEQERRQRRDRQQELDRKLLEKHGLTPEVKRQMVRETMKQITGREEANGRDNQR